jgi:redox-sensing transcriptional repressor
MKNIPKTTIARLSLYLKCFTELCDLKVNFISSQELAKLIGLNSAQVRKDLSYFGKFGRRGVGYNVENLRQQISEILGTHKIWNVGIIGIGNLGRALLSYSGFKQRGFKIVAGFDIAPEKIGWEVEGINIYSINELEKIIKKEKIEIIILTIPKEAMFEVINKLRKTNIKGILNFAGKYLVGEENFKIRNVDISLELEQLTFFIKNQTTIRRQ